MREIQEQILSFGELQEPHEVITIAYAGVRMKLAKCIKVREHFQLMLYSKL